MDGAQSPNIGEGDKPTEQKRVGRAAILLEDIFRPLIGWFVD